MKIAVIGAGLVGVACSWYLLDQLKGNCQLTLFDSNEIAGGASGIAAGLVHPFSGAHAKLNRQGREAFAKTVELLKVASHTRSVYSTGGILRLAMDANQVQDYFACSQKYEDVEWCDVKRTQEKMPGVYPAPSIWIRSALSVHTKLYLQELWKACESMGGVFNQRKICDLKELDDYDLILVTVGSQIKFFSEFKHLPLQLTKGQLLLLEWPGDLKALPMPLNSYLYLMMDEGDRNCLVGATYERDFTNSQPDANVAKDLLLFKLERMYPPLKDAKILECRADVRVSTPNHLPLGGMIHPKLWFLTGMGSKGLLYHAYYAEQIATNIIKGIV